MSFFKGMNKKKFLIKDLLFKLQVFNLYVVRYQGRENIVSTA